MPLLKFKKLHPQAVIPKYAHATDAGFDLVTVETLALAPGAKATISLGLASEIPEGYFVSFRDRSGLAAKHGLHVLAGVIDAGYRGEWKVVMVNLGHETYEIAAGERIAQGIFHKLPAVKIVEVDRLGDSERGEGGFGSSGK